MIGWHRAGFRLYWLYDDQDVGPAGPTVAESGPEKVIQGVEFGQRPLSLQDCDLLSEGQYLEGGITSTAEENSDADNE
jgi:hypothetical protein